MNILAATNFSTRSHRAVRRAGLLARDRGGEVTLVHVVDDDRPAGQAALDRSEAERMLAEQVASISELSGLAARVLVMEGDPHEAILRAAAETHAALIVMGSHHRQKLRNVLLGTTIERVVRTGAVPVLMVNDEVDRPYRTALGAVDLSEPSAAAIRTAAKLGFPTGARLTLVHAFLAPAKAKMAYAGLGHEAIGDYVAEEHEAATRELIGFLGANALDDQGPSARIEEGPPFQVIARTVEQVKPDVVIIGTHGRSMLAKALLGSVAEEVLRALPVDVLAVPRAR